jgi:hypothetical protein
MNKRRLIFYHFVLKVEDFVEDVLLYREIFRTLQPVKSVTRDKL